MSRDGVCGCKTCGAALSFVNNLKVSFGMRSCSSLHLGDFWRSFKCRKDSMHEANVWGIRAGLVSVVSLRPTKAPSWSPSRDTDKALSTQALHIPISSTHKTHSVAPPTCTTNDFEARKGTMNVQPGRSQFALKFTPTHQKPPRCYSPFINRDMCRVSVAGMLNWGRSVLG